MTSAQPPAKQEPPKQCEALRGNKQCTGAAVHYWPEMNRWVCLRHMMAAVTMIRFVERQNDGTP
jgi:hypothetical protein